MSLPRPTQTAAGWVLTAVAIPLAPLCWVAAVFLHGRACGPAFFCEESFLDGLAHTVLISLSPQLAVLSFAIGDELRLRR